MAERANGRGNSPLQGLAAQAAIGGGRPEPCTQTVPREAMRRGPALSTAPTKHGQQAFERFRLRQPESAIESAPRFF